jgi:hypothetical protein
LEVEGAVKIVLFTRGQPAMSVATVTVVVAVGGDVEEGVDVVDWEEEEEVWGVTFLAYLHQQSPH